MSCTVYFGDIVKRYPSGEISADTMRRIFGLSGDTYIKLENFRDGEPVTHLEEGGLYSLNAEGTTESSSVVLNTTSTSTVGNPSPPKISRTTIVSPKPEGFRIPTAARKDARVNLPRPAPTTKQTNDDIVFMVRLVNKNEYGFPDDSYQGKSTLVYIERGEINYDVAVATMREFIDPFPDEFNIYVQSARSFAHIQKLQSPTQDHQLWIKTFATSATGRKEAFKTLFVVPYDDYFVDVIGHHDIVHNRMMVRVREELEEKKEECEKLREEAHENHQNFKTAQRTATTMTTRVHRVEKDLVNYKKELHYKIRCGSCLKTSKNMTFCGQCRKLGTCGKCARVLLTNDEPRCPLCRVVWKDEDPGRTVFFYNGYEDIVDDELEGMYAFEEDD